MKSNPRNIILVHKMLDGKVTKTVHCHYSSRILEDPASPHLPTDRRGTYILYSVQVHRLPIQPNPLQMALTQVWSLLQMKSQLQTTPYLLLYQQYTLSQSMGSPALTVREFVRMGMVIERSCFVCFFP